MITLISQSNIESINKVATELVQLLKSSKLYADTCGRVDRIKPSLDLFVLPRFFDDKQKYYSIAATNDKTALEQLETLTNQLSELLQGKTAYMLAKVKEYCSKSIKVKLCRALVSELEDLYVLGDIDRDDINDVYSTLNKPIPKKFSASDLLPEGAKVRALLGQAVRGDAAAIKADSVKHYADLTNRIDPQGTLSPKEFLSQAFNKLSDINAIRLCMAYKFKRDSFDTLINEDFDMLVNVAANKIADFHTGINEESEIRINDISLGAKGFETSITIDGKTSFTRAIPVEGCFVRFHYRYIIT